MSLASFELTNTAFKIRSTVGGNPEQTHKEDREDEFMAAWTKAAARAAAYAIALGLTGVMAACGGGAETADPVAKTAFSTTSSALVQVQLPVSNWTDEDGQHVVRNISDWERVWDANNGIWPAQPAPPLTEIDFRRHMLVGVTSSVGGCGGNIAILSAEPASTPSGEGWLVRFQVDERSTDPGMVCTMDIKPLADFILLPQSPLPVRFVELPRLG